MKWDKLETFSKPRDSESPLTSAYILEEISVPKHDSNETYRIGLRLAPVIDESPRFNLSDHQPDDTFFPVTDGRISGSHYRKFDAFFEKHQTSDPSSGEASIDGLVFVMQQLIE